MTRVVIFEDNKDYRLGIASLIDATTPFMVAGSFGNCNNLLARVKETKPDIILMDIGLPDISGIEAVRLLSSTQPKVAILMQTIFEDEDNVFASICAGASGYILKSDGPEKLILAMTQVCNGGAAFTPSIAKKVLGMVKPNEQTLSPEHFNLTGREREVLQHLVKGYSYKEIASVVNLSVETIHSHIKKIYEKLHVHSMSAAVAKAIRHRIAG